MFSRQPVHHSVFRTEPAAPAAAPPARAAVSHRRHRRPGLRLFHVLRAHARSADRRAAPRRPRADGADARRVGAPRRAARHRRHRPAGGDGVRLDSAVRQWAARLLRVRDSVSVSRAGVAPRSARPPSAAFAARPAVQQPRGRGRDAVDVRLLEAARRRRRVGAADDRQGLFHRHLAGAGAAHLRQRARPRRGVAAGRDPHHRAACRRSRGGDCLRCAAGQRAGFRDSDSGT